MLDFLADNYYCNKYTITLPQLYETGVALLPFKENTIIKNLRIEILSDCNEPVPVTLEVGGVYSQPFDSDTICFQEDLGLPLCTLKYHEVKVNVQSDDDFQIIYDVYELSHKDIETLNDTELNVIPFEGSTQVLKIVGGMGSWH